MSEDLLRDIEKYKRLLKKGAKTASILSRYIEDLNSNIKELNTEVQALLKDADIFKLWKTLLSGLGVDAEAAGESVARALLGYIEKHIEEDIENIVAKFNLQIVLDTIKALSASGILPIILYNYLRRAIKEDCYIMSQQYAKIMQDIDAIDKNSHGTLNAASNVNLSPLIENAMTLVYRDKIVNSQILVALETPDSSGIMESLLQDHNTNLEQAMELIYPGDMLKDPYSGKDYQKYKYIYSSKSPVKAIKSAYEDTALASKLAGYRTYLSALESKINGLSDTIDTYNSANVLLQLHLRSLQKLLPYLKKYQTLPEIGTAQVIAGARGELQQRITFDNTMLDTLASMLHEKNVVNVELKRVALSNNILVELQKTADLNLMQYGNTAQLKEELQIIEDCKPNDAVKMLNIELQDILNAILSTAMSKDAYNRLVTGLNQIKETAILNEKGINYYMNCMDRLKPIEMGKGVEQMGNLSRLLGSCSIEDPNPALYSGDIEEIIKTVEDALAPVVAYVEDDPFLRKAKIYLGGKKSVLATTQDISHLKLVKITALHKHKKKLEETVKMATKLLNGTEGTS